MNIINRFRRNKEEFHLENILQMNRKNPRTFLKPTSKSLTQLEVGDLVKLIFVMTKVADDGCRAERMWVRITEINKNSYKGKLDNDPFYISSVKAGDEIDFKVDNIAEVYVVDLGFDESKFAIITKRAIEERQVNWATRTDDLHNEQDSGWQFFYGDEDEEYMGDVSNSMIVKLEEILRFEPLLEEAIVKGYNACEYDDKDNRFVQVVE